MGLLKPDVSMKTFTEIESKLNDTAVKKFKFCNCFAEKNISIGIK